MSDTATVDALGPINPLTNIVQHLIEQQHRAAQTAAPAAQRHAELERHVPQFLRAWNIVAPEDPTELYYIADKYDAYLRRYKRQLFEDAGAASNPELLLRVMEQHFAMRVEYD